MLQRVHTLRVIRKRGECETLENFLFLFFGPVESFPTSCVDGIWNRNIECTGKVLLNALQDTFRDVSTHLSVSPTLLKDDGPMGGWMVPNTGA